MSFFRRIADFTTVLVAGLFLASKLLRKVGEAILDVASKMNTVVA